MSIEKPEQSHEGMNNSHLERINVLIEKLNISPDFNYVYGKDRYPELAEAGYESIEIMWFHSGQIVMDATHPRADTQQQADIYTFKPTEYQVEHRIMTTNNISEQVGELKAKLSSLRTDLPIYERYAKYAYNSMWRLIREDGEHDDVLNDYEATQLFIADGRTIEEADDELCHLLDARESENEAKLARLFEKVALTNGEVNELLKMYDDAKRSLEMESVHYEALGDHMSQLAEVQFGETTIADPQAFIQLLEMLVAIREKSNQ